MLERFQPHAYALVRIVAGFMFAMHGSQKLLGWPVSRTSVGDLPALMTVAGAIELIAGLMILLGFLTGFAAFISSGQMAVAFFMVKFPAGWNPLLNEGELAALYSFVFLYIATRGSGFWSIDALRGKRPAARELTRSVAPLVEGRPA